jgi:transposase
MEKIDARSLAPKAQESIRRLAVQAVLEGKKQVEVAKMVIVQAASMSNDVAVKREGAS